MPNFDKESILSAVSILIRFWVKFWQYFNTDLILRYQECHFHKFDNDAILYQFRYWCHFKCWFNRFNFWWSFNTDSILNADLTLIQFCRQFQHSTILDADSIMMWFYVEFLDTDLISNNNSIRQWFVFEWNFGTIRFCVKFQH